MNYFFFAHLIFYRKPVVVCISDIRIQTNVHHDNDRPNQFPNRRTTEDNLTLPNKNHMHLFGEFHFTANQPLAIKCH
jgi:hypothetical protein